MRQFKVLGYKLPENCPKTVPWEMLVPFEDYAKKNHDQDLEKLHSRGGLGPEEIYMIMNRLRWGKHNCPTEEVAVAFLLDKVAQFNASKTQPK